jgi:hypothetical protein
MGIGVKEHMTSFGWCHASHKKKSYFNLPHWETFKETLKTIYNTHQI